MTPDLDLNKSVWTKTRGGITAIGTWVRVEGDFRPCMVLIRAGSEYDDRLVPCVVMQDRAWIWDEKIGDPAEAAGTIALFAPYLGLSLTDAPACIRLSFFINDLLGDLLHIPPYTPDRDAPVVSEITLINHTTGTSVESEMRDV